MKKALVNTIQSLLDNDPEVFFLTADLGYMAFEHLFETHPGRAINVGVSEANMIGAASGLAREGLKPICYSMVPFITLRCLEQIKIQMSIDQCRIILIGVGAAYTYGVQGSSHHSIEDIGVMRSMIGINFYHPSDPFELENSLRYSVAENSPSYIRIGWPEHAFERLSSTFDNPCLLPVTEGTDHTVIATGITVGSTVQAFDQCDNAPSIFSASRISPFNVQEFIELARRSKSVAVVEPGRQSGGLGEFLASIIAVERLNTPICILSCPDQYFEFAGSKLELEHQAGISPEKIRLKLDMFHDSIDG